MASYQESEHFAEDFREALEDLQMNNRYDIQNLTMIARENTEHALAIAQTLQSHIKRIAAHKKLPSLYVLDSIVKNVGTPYTLFFGKKLFETFMEAYASVDMPTRRKMDEMLKTWKEPIPGSIDTRPVFPPDVTRPIENALIKARTSAMQAQQQHYRNEQQLLGRGRAMPPQPPPMPYRETPTPPGARPPSQTSGYGPPNGAPYGHPSQPPQGPYHPPHQPPHAHGQPAPSRSTPQPPLNMTAFQPPYHGGFGMPQPAISVDALNEDIQQLTTAFKADFARNPHDPSIQTRLKALLDLQSILQTQNLPQDQLVLIKNRIAELAVTIRATPAQTPTPVPIPQAVAVAPPPAAPPAAPQMSIDSLLGSGALAALMARGSATPQVSTPQPPPATVAIKSPPPQQVEPRKPATPAPTNPMSLVDMLRKAGMLPGAAAPGGSTPAPNVTPAASLPFPLPIPVAAAPAMPKHTNDPTLTLSSLKQFRPYVVPVLFESLGTQCTQCGRRFKNDEEGKKKKTAHMDWHFKVNQRIAEADKAGQSRSWLVDETDWIKTRETVDVDHIATAGRTDGAGASESKAPKMQYIPVPDDPLLLNSMCPICQEKFKQVYLDEEWAWEDATRVGDRIYHASCHQEATGSSLPVIIKSRGTPEPVLGKRKAEQDELTGLKGKRLMDAW